MVVVVVVVVANFNNNISHFGCENVRTIVADGVVPHCIYADFAESSDFITANNDANWGRERESSLFKRAAHSSPHFG